MADQSGRSTPDLESELLNNARSFNFFQAVRLLRLLNSREPKKGSDIRMRPELSLAFPTSDVVQIEHVAEDHAAYRMDLSFLGLYGPSSPLPTFYTEDLFSEHAEEESVTRDFLDILNQRIYELFFNSWSKYRQYLQIAEEKDQGALERLFSLLGLGEDQLREQLPESFKLIRYIGLFTQFPRSALGLKTLLRDALQIDALDIEPCVPRWVPIPEDQRARLGQAPSRLGADIFVGSHILDRMTMFSIHIGPLKKRAFQELMPGMPKYELLVSLVRLYVTDALEYDLNLTLQPGEAQKTCLGGAQWSTLGLDTWSFSGESLGTVGVGFHPESLQQA